MGHYKKINMKKYLISLVFLMFALSTPIFASASTQGTCSWHGGVNCSAGSDWDGSAICSDGWRDSSEKFYSQKACKEALHHCSTEVSTNLEQKYRLREIYDEMLQISAEMEKYSLDSTDTMSETRQKAISTLELSSQHQALRSEYNYAETDYYNECYSIGESEYYKEVADFYKEYLASQETASNTSSDNTQTKTLYCPDGYSLSSNNLCMTYTQSCQAVNNADSNIIGFKGANGKISCNCISGYSWSGSQCFKDVSIVDIAPPIVEAPKKETVQEIPDEKPKQKLIMKETDKEKEDQNSQNNDKSVSSTTDLIASSTPSITLIESKPKEHLFSKTINKIVDWIFNIFK